MNVVIIPSVGGGIGYFARTATLARMLQKLDPTVSVEYLLDTERLRPFNIAAARTGPFLELDDVPERDVASARLGFASNEQIVVYAPRGMPFGREFGERVLADIFRAVAALRIAHPQLRLVLLAVSNRAEVYAPKGILTEPGKRDEMSARAQALATVEAVSRQRHA